MSLTRRTLIALSAATVAAGFLGTAAMAQPVVHVSLWDKGENSADDFATAKLGYGMGGDMSKATMGITVEPKTIKAGKVTLDATNDSKSMIHEMIISPVPPEGKLLPYLKDENRVAEEKAGHLGEVSELEPGQSGALTITLKPGKYLLYCNIPGHYVLGMWTELDVTK